MTQDNKVDLRQRSTQLNDAEISSLSWKIPSNLTKFSNPTGANVFYQVRFESIAFLVVKNLLL
jgi:hypothetical protein